jgi:OmcA/MtrC family decaheme c-type cytochrome
VNFDGSAIPGVDFATGVGHAGGAQADNSGCFFCHGPTSGPSPIITRHTTENQTPNNPRVPAGLSLFEYGIDNVTVADDNTTATIRFWIKQDGAFMNLGDNGAVIAQPAGTSGTGGPSFLFAYAMAQDGVQTPADYTNLGRPAAQPASLAVVGLTIADKAADNSQFTVVVSNAFPNVNPLTGAVGKATMRAVGLQAYFSQNGIGRHTAAVMRPVTGDAVRRTIVKSGYVNSAGQPVTDPTQFATATTVGCLECHEVFEGHGGNRVNNVQVCVMCHNPNLSSSGRTILPANGTTDNVQINPVITARFGNNPTLYPEVANGMKELIHGLHAGPFRRVSPWEDIRNRTTGGFKGVFISSDEITYPGYLGNCAKCHLPGTFDTDLPANLVLTTHVIAPDQIIISTDNQAIRDFITANIVPKRNTVPNADDLVVSPNASACGHCHNSPAAIKHFQSAGGAIKVSRTVGSTPPPSLGPDITP